jgi:hypothetical protein
MQNNKISLLTIFFVSCLCVSTTVGAQEVVDTVSKKKEPVVSVRPSDVLVVETNVSGVALDQSEANGGNPLAIDETTVGDAKVDKKTMPVAPKMALKPIQSATKNIQSKIKSVREENKVRLEEELKNTSVGNKTIVDFPNRSSLGTMELAPLPGISETTVGGPLPMARSVSGKDLPSEQLLGRITPEVFQEMADLERGNTFLKLQLEKEKLKNDLEKLKATYRSSRLDEISKRESVVRSRIQWWQEQEKLRLEIEKKQAEEEELARKIAEQEAAREQLRLEAQQRLKEPKQDAINPQGEIEPQVEIMSIESPLLSMEELYTLDSIRGIGTDLSAILTDKNDGSILVVKKDDILPSGHVVREIKKGIVSVAYGNRVDQLIFRPVIK